MLTKKIWHDLLSQWFFNYLIFARLSFIQCFFAVPTLFSAGDADVKQWDLESNSCIRTFRHSSSVVCLAATVDAHRLLTGDGSGLVLLWDIATGQQLASVRAHPEYISCLAVTPDGCSFVSGSWDLTLKLWRFDALQLMIQFIGHTGYVKACVVSSDGSRLYSGSEDKSIRVWDMSTGQQLASMQSHTSLVTSLALSGSLLASGSFDKTVKLWDTGSMQLLDTLCPRGFVFSVAVSSDGTQRVLSGGGCNNFTNNYNVCVWDAASGAQLAELQGHSASVRWITVSSNGRWAASCSHDGSIFVWHLDSLSLCAKLEGHRTWVLSVLFVWCKLYEIAAYDVLKLVEFSSKIPLEVNVNTTCCKNVFTIWEVS